MFWYSPLSQDPSGSSSTPRSWRPSFRNVRTILALVIAALLFAIVVSLTSLNEPVLSSKAIYSPVASNHKHTGPDENKQELSAAKNQTETVLYSSKVAPPKASPTPKAGNNLPGTDDIQWNDFAYVQYVTNFEYLCNSVMVFESLHRLGCKAQRLMMHPRDFNAGPDTTEGKPLAKARDEYKVTLQPVEIQSKDTSDFTWESYTKLLAMNMTTHAKRVLSLDSNSTVLQCLDELFTLPPSPVVMPRAYWEWPEKYELSSQLLLVEMNSAEFQRIMKKVEKAGDNQFDMDIPNKLYMSNAMVLPNRQYDLVTGEFRHNRSDHSKYLGNPTEKWDPVKVIKETKFLHFSDWPIPKPWIAMDEADFKEYRPKWQGSYCGDKDMWINIYGDFRRRRQDVCGIDVGGYTQKHKLPM
ncbi:MAG: N-acetylglucosaminyltransferase [Stictis urceolatum]|nr:N-acetylglucosaminyltransferase [Stictis urceolata]